MSIVSCRLFWSYPKRFATFSDCCNVAIEDSDLNCDNMKSLDSKAITTHDVILLNMRLWAAVMGGERGALKMHPVYNVFTHFNDGS